jgi:outer membrane protein assembly factor BamB
MIPSPELSTSEEISILSNRAKFARMGVILTAALFLAGTALGCTGLPLEASWADVSLYGTPPQIMFVYNDQFHQVDPADGSRSELRDASGRVRLDEQGNPRVWTVAQPSSGRFTFYTRPIQLEDDILLSASYENRLFEIDPAAGRILRQEGYPLPGHVVATPVLNADAGLLYVPLTETNLAAVETTSFLTVWTHPTERGVWASPLLHEGVLYVPSMDHNLYALNAVTGDELWRLNLGGAVASTPVVANGALYVSSFGRRVTKVSFSGQVIASFPTAEWVWGAPAVIGDEVYIADLAGSVYALRDTGSAFQQVWTRQVATRGIRATPLVSGDTIVVGARDRFVYWLDRATGEERIKREMRGDVLADLLLIQPDQVVGINEPFVVVSTLAREELLVAFTLDDGERKWVFP